MKSKTAKLTKRPGTVEGKKGRKVGTGEKGRENNGTITEGGRKINPSVAKSSKV
jgi:hypothetical protein